MGRVLVRFTEQPSSGTEQQRKDQQGVAVDQSRVGQTHSELAAAIHQQRAAIGFLDAATSSIERRIVAGQRESSDSSVVDTT